MEDPNEAERPDYTTEEHQAARQQLVDEGLTNEQAARSLAALWTLSNNAAKEHMRQREEDDEEQRQQLLIEEQDISKLKQPVQSCTALCTREDRKKNKKKYAPLVRGKVPSDPTIIPTQYATRKLKAGDYCELHYFTNRGLEDAKVSNLIAEPDTLVM
ncbi:hypothetical protein BDR07DRAFT_1246784, partial [Suillus spraguei]